MKKPIFEVDVSEDVPSSLEAHSPLSLAEESGCFHTANGLRMPLGIYNISASRLCDKVLRLCGHLEEYFQASDTLEPLKEYDVLMQQIIDYIELALYATAEHVNDIYSIAAGFFRTKVKATKDHRYRRIDKAVKAHKRFISAAANHIKHQQSRIRMFSMEFSQNNISGCLHGYFIEGVEKGVVCPSSTFHRNQDVFSITTLVWEIIYLLLNCSRDLTVFLNSTASQIVGPPYIKFPPFSKAIIAAARLPIYTFGEEHPFARATLRIKASDGIHDELDSGLYGSIKKGWSRTASTFFGNAVSRFEGDGTTRSFRFAQPKSVSLHHWD